MSVQGIDEAQHVAGVMKAKAIVKPGGVVRELRSLWDRTGYVTAGAATAAEAMCLARQAMARVKVEVSPTTT